MLSPFTEAMLWKAELEQRDAAKFIMHNGVYRIKDKSTWRYYCHRNGVYTPKGSGKRQLKIQGSLKTTRSCPAAFVVVGSDSKFHVSYYSKHYGHEHDLGHLTLSPTDREQIAGIIHQIYYRCISKLALIRVFMLARLPLLLAYVVTGSLHTPAFSRHPTGSSPPPYEGEIYFLPRLLGLYIDIYTVFMHKSGHYRPF